MSSETTAAPRLRINILGNTREEQAEADAKARAAGSLWAPFHYEYFPAGEQEAAREARKRAELLAPVIASKINQ